MVTGSTPITRHPARAALLAKYQVKQKELRNWQGLFNNRSYAKLAEELARKDARIAEIERQVEILKRSYRAMIQAVEELGGINQWLKFYRSHPLLREDLEMMGVMLAAEAEELDAMKIRETSLFSPELQHQTG